MSFNVGSISAGFNLDTSQWTGAFSQVIANVDAFPGIVATHLDAPMAHLGPVMGEAAAAIASSARQAGNSLGSNFAQGAAQARSAIGVLPSSMQSAANAVGGSAQEAGNAIGNDLAAGVAQAQAAMQGLAPQMDSAAQSVANSARSAGEGIGSGIGSGLLSAEAAMQLFPALAIELIADPIVAAVAIAKEAMQGLGDVFEGVAERFHKIGLDATKSGMSPEAFSTYAAAAKASGVEIDQFSNSLKFMEERAANALRGDESGAKAFADLGISAKELAGLLDNPEKMLLRVADAFKEIGGAAERNQAAMELGRPIADMIPFLSQGSQGIQRLAGDLGDLGARVTENQVIMGERWSVVDAKFSAMWQHIKTSLGEPILAALETHIDGIMETIGGAMDWLGKMIDKFMPVMIEWGTTVVGALESIADVVTSIFTPAFEVLEPILSAVARALKLIVDIGATAGHAVALIINTALHGIDSDEANASRAKVERAASRVSGDFGADNAGAGAKVNVNANISLDPHEASTQIAQKLQPHIQRGHEELKRGYEAAANHRQVVNAFGGRPR